ncbi:MAG TPA: thiamine pyrophosphate-dependent enzyme [Spirochaetota bacterium]|nr:thiamine pyrophosphate-dependent enzyme [Spirochaetota bacterium]HOL56943.1 thiamine pyrophosphate-dependent enzyme [Spirochaetota bacterium]HPP04481.1 thiamine pyrophosphate-dependent enzyme [Spirochaetota bacterium]
MQKILFSGNEAIAYGAYKVGVKVGAGYPGTPSTQILENLKDYEGVYTEWSVNEKVALEVGIGASYAGSRTIVTMKHVGLNVAADPLFTLSYTGVNGGLVIVTADDPDAHSSQNEQDNRNFAKAAKIPMLEPSDSQEAMEFTELAFELSEKYDTPILLRPTTRICHSKSVVIDNGRKPKDLEIKGFKKNPEKYVMIPAFARKRHIEVEKRLAIIKEDSNNLSINIIELNSKKIGFITSGISYQYVKDAFPEASILKLGMVYPLPEKKIKEFVSLVENVFIVEELDPFIETEIKAMGINIEGKKYLPVTGELNIDIIKRAFSFLIEKEEKKESIKIDIKIPPRPPALCPGCPHRNVFNTLKKFGAIVSGDIGCYTLGVMPPFNSLDTCLDMGASITIAHGMAITGKHNKPVAVIGDSTFAHSGITGLLNAAYNRQNILVIVLDNGTTAMTGMQPNPLSGERITGETTVQLDYKKLAESVGITGDDFAIVDAYKPDEIEKNIESMLKSKNLSFLVVKGLCVIFGAKKKKKK